MPTVSIATHRIGATRRRLLLRPSWRYSSHRLEPVANGGLPSIRPSELSDTYLHEPDVSLALAQLEPAFFDSAFDAGAELLAAGFERVEESRVDSRYGCGRFGLASPTVEVARP